MKRRPRNKATNETDNFMLSRLDESLDALNKNEDELIRVVNELMKRDLTESEIDSIRSNYSIYCKNTAPIRKKLGE